MLQIVSRSKSFEGEQRVYRHDSAALSCVMSLGVHLPPQARSSRCPVLYRPDRLVEACRAAGHPIDLRMRDGYDHSYYFVASFLEGHFDHHAKALDR